MSQPLFAVLGAPLAALATSALAALGRLPEDGPGLLYAAGQGVLLLAGLALVREGLARNPASGARRIVTPRGDGRVLMEVRENL